MWSRNLPIHSRLVVWVLLLPATCCGMVKNKYKAFQHITKCQTVTGDLKMEMLNRCSILCHASMLQIAA